MTLVVSIGATIIEGATLGAVTSAAVTGSTVGSIGAGVIGGATLGSGLGAVKSAIAGEDVGKGALMGAATGAVGGGLAPGVGGKPIGTAALIGGLTGGALAGVNATGAPAVSGPVSTPASGVSVGMDQPGALDVLGSKLTDMSGSQMLQNVGILGAGSMAESAVNQKPEAAANVTPALAPGLPSAMKPKDVYNQGPLGGMGSIGMAQGGQVPLKNGAYIIPADVVSALGNGSSKAGADFLRRLMNEVKSEAVSRHGLGAAHRAIA